MMDYCMAREHFVDMGEQMVRHIYDVRYQTICLIYQNNHDDCANYRICLKTTIDQLRLGFHA